jgi:cell division protein FtsI (penicillin-binding protein 3)
MAFGQGVGVTGMQLATALSAVANGGVLMTPLLVRRIVNPDGETIRTFTPKSRRRVISRYTARLLGDIMTSVTEEGGTGTEGALLDFLVAGKTGTAQKAEGSKGYDEDKWIASFIGFVPARNPRLAVTVVIDEPLISYYGGTVAAPALRRVADQALKYLGVSPERVMPRKKGKAPMEKAARQTPAEAETQVESDIAAGVSEALEPNQVLVPDFTGMSMKQVLDHLSVLGLRPLFQGTGFVEEQIPPPLAPLARGSFIQVNFAPETREAPEPQVDDGDAPEAAGSEKTEKVQLHEDRI